MCSLPKLEPIFLEKMELEIKKNILPRILKIKRSGYGGKKNN